MYYLFREWKGCCTATGIITNTVLK